MQMSILQTGDEGGARTFILDIYLYRILAWLDCCILESILAESIDYISDQLLMKHN